VSVLTTRQKREVEESEARARVAIAEILPLLGTIDQASFHDVAAKLEEALEAARAAKKDATSKVREKSA
jgi:hypothetical protein